MLVLAAIVLASIAACTIDVASDEASPGAATGAGPERARADLATLTVAAQRSMKGYSRDHFPHWNGQGEGCDTRDVVLQRDGTGVRVGDSCKITKGQWLSPYDGKTFTNPRQLDIDHMVPLANAWRSGADSWDDEKRSAFANDLTRPQLLAVSATTNRAKGDQDPSQWRPPDKGYWCEYAQRWIAVKHHWNLAVTAAEKSKLSEMLETCG
ncbi:MAG: HNH endonuclease [Dactylosporangium sp.]|nr:HNH endonuclease family protein [Dactylosporangium sp.]NNJ61352.1 HNH endonuclease [Dactylosporangium sp.]